MRRLLLLSLVALMALVVFPGCEGNDGGISETGTEVELTADFDLLQRYRHGLAAWQEELRLFCGARGMHYAPVETALPFEELLFAWLRQRGVLK